MALQAWVSKSFRSLNPKGHSDEAVFLVDFLRPRLQTAFGLVLLVLRFSSFRADRYQRENPHYTRRERARFAGSATGVIGFVRRRAHFWNDVYASWRGC